jgi:hypothetical protein
MPDDPTGSTDEKLGGNGPDNVLFDLYRAYIGEPDAETDVYLGFGLFIGGIAILAIALGLFLWAGAYEPRTWDYWWRVGPAYGGGMLAVPLTLLGIVVLLPVENRALYASIAGTAVTVLAVAAFGFAYPHDWNGYGADYTIPIVATYALGLTAVVASTGAALIAHQIEKHKPSVAPHEIEGIEEEGPEPGDEEYWSDEEIRKDIEEAMAETDISWGGIEKSDNRKLKLNTETIDSTELSGMKLDPDVKRETGGVDAQVSGLRQLRGGETKTTTAQNSTVDDQTAALNQLKMEKREGKAPDTSPTRDDEDGLVDRFRGMFG